MLTDRTYLLKKYPINSDLVTVTRNYYGTASTSMKIIHKRRSECQVIVFPYLWSLEKFSAHNLHSYEVLTTQTLSYSLKPLINKESSVNLYFQYIFIYVSN